MKVAVSLGLLSAVASANPLLRIGTIHHDAAPVLSSSNAQHIPNAYIVKFKDHVQQHHAAAHHAWVNDLHTTHESRKLELRKRDQFPFVDDALHGLKHTYNIAGSFMGYSGHFDDAVIEQLRRHPDVSCSPSQGSHSASLVFTSRC
jgi:cerevisin